MLVVAALDVGAAATGPLFFRAAGGSILRDALNEALLPTRLVNDHALAPLPQDPFTQVRTTSARRVAERPTTARPFDAPVESLSVRTGATVGGATPATVLLTYRDGVCGHVRVVDGVCPDQPAQRWSARIRCRSKGGVSGSG